MSRCETCEHEKDSGTEYCGACDALTDNYKEAGWHIKERLSMAKGIPDCPDCGGKSMCLKHRVEYLKWIYETARDEYFAAFEDYRLKLEERINNELPTDNTS